MGACDPFDDAELAALARTFAAGRLVDLRDRALLTLGCSCPARVSEMLVLSEAGVTEPDGRVAGMWHCAAANSKTGVAVDYEIRAAAREALEAWLPARRRAGYRRGDPLFPSLGRVGALTRQGAWSMVKRRCAAAGLRLRGKGTHSMKKTSINRAYDSRLAAVARGEQGVDPLRDTQAFSGHKSLDAMLCYLRPRTKAARAAGFEAAERSARLLMVGGGGDGKERGQDGR